jgi:hypothetical protein
MIDERTIMGTYFGYPSCCQEYFINRTSWDEGNFPLRGTGYIPCPLCRKNPKKN